ncbi:zinc finger protein CONSTANS-LIKE 16-like isoform X2 [Durio zibethinus]|uniref:Zinc finger protein CONSTANS-LIKE 16-like isoform X2 n=1 Tax=Durio zibethinus TaxID=66656 RepID=A0A6P5XDG9_DURZI|nr:zinc finger protein CONSTANS-LIKE 16-like isoform X2 [Durio zibethinus]
MISTKNVANAIGGKTARACDSCIKKRAGWYCAADDAFLCQACDSSVHSANPLARRHERVRLKTASVKSSNNEAPLESFSPSWDKGFTRKARTRRPAKASIHQKPFKAENTKRNNNPAPLVPEVGADEISHEENEEEKFPHRVPIFDPFVSEPCASATSNDATMGAVRNDSETAAAAASESKAFLACNGHDVNGSHGLFPSEMDLAEFAADVESLLGKGLENESFAMEEIGLMDSKKDLLRDCSLENGKVKIEDEESFEAGKECHVDSETDTVREPFELSFNYESPATCGEENELVKEEVTVKSNGDVEYEEDTAKKKRKLLLSLDYEAVSTAWTSQGSPWTSGGRPDFDPDECWPDCMVAFYLMFPWNWWNRSSPQL